MDKKTLKLWQKYQGEVQDWNGKLLESVMEEWERREKRYRKELAKYEKNLADWRKRREKYNQSSFLSKFLGVAEEPGFVSFRPPYIPSFMPNALLMEATWEGFLDWCIENNVYADADSSKEGR